MEPLHAVDKLNAISIELPAIAVDQSRCVTKCESRRDGGVFMVEQRNGALSHDSDAKMRVRSMPCLRKMLLELKTFSN
jgi:hypothetical protein